MIQWVFLHFLGGGTQFCLRTDPNLFIQEVIYKNCANKLKYAVRVVSSVRDFYFINQKYLTVICILFINILCCLGKTEKRSISCSNYSGHKRLISWYSKKIWKRLIFHSKHFDAKEINLPLKRKIGFSTLQSWPIFQMLSLATTQSKVNLT